MEPIISKLQEGVKYPRFERDATTIINDLVEHITKERGVYSSSIEPNPNEHKVWFNTNNNTLNIYENGKWNTISGQGGSSSSGAHFFNAVLGGTTNNVSGIISGGTISGATISGGNIHGATLGAINVTSGNINYANINNAYIKDSTITGTINASTATISGATISDATIKEGRNLNYGNRVLVTYTGTVSNPMLIPDGGAIGYPNKNIKISNVTISGSKIEANRIDFISGEHQCMIYPLGSYLAFSSPLADMTLFHSIDLNHGSIAGLTSIKTLSYTGLSIEPYDVTGTGTPIAIHGRAAGLSLGVNSTAPFTLDGISSLNWKNGSSNGYMMKFNTNNNTINSNYDTFNIANGNIKLTSGLISGSANVDLTLSGTISGGTISGATISGGNISSATINNCIIDNKGYLYHGSNILVTYTGTSDKPVLIPYGGIIGYNSASLTLCGVTLTGGDFTKLKNLQ